MTCNLKKVFSDWLQHISADEISPRRSIRQLGTSNTPDPASPQRPGDETDTRQAIINTLLTTPHRDLTALHPLHAAMLDSDPRFYAHLAAWYFETGQVRDHKEMFVVVLCLASDPAYRDVGLALLRQLAPHQVARVIDFIKGTDLRISLPMAPRLRNPQARSKSVRVKAGLFTNVPRSMRTEVERYLREREQDEQRFDRLAVQSRKVLKHLYAGLHIQPGLLAQKILFDETPPAGTLAHSVKQISQASSPAEQARAISEQRVPYRVAVSLVHEMTPMVLAALLDVMTPQEVINNLAALTKRGAMDNPETKALLEARLTAAKSDSRVSAYKAQVAAEAAGAEGELAGILSEVTESQVKARGRITRPSALLIDKSGSMEMAIEAGRQLGALISTICDADLYAYAFDRVAFDVTPQGSGSLADWDKAVAGIKAGGGTACGVAIDQMRRKKQRVEQFIMITDEGENSLPNFAPAYEQYAVEMGLRPAVILVKIGTTSNLLERECARIGVSPNVFEFRGDYYALPNVIPLLTYPTLTELVMTILDQPLPKRRPA